jgi:hypothetical protein
MSENPSVIIGVRRTRRLSPDAAKVRRNDYLGIPDTRANSG